jgi:hypothetical protein
VLPVTQFDAHIPEQPTLWPVSKDAKSRLAYKVRCAISGPAFAVFPVIALAFPRNSVSYLALVWCLYVGDDDKGSFESAALRRREISMVTV